MPRPSFFLVGAPKCGTTSLCHYLSQHPEIFVPSAKELHFFDSDLNVHRHYNTKNEYIDMFSCSNKRIAGEGTVWYLYSTIAAQEIFRFDPNARIIISIRNPVEMIYSLFRFRRYSGGEKLDLFTKALDREQEYLAALPSKTYVDQRYIYTDAANYFDQIRRYIDIFGHTSLHIVDFEDIKVRPEKVYAGILRFLGVSDEFRPAFRNVNQTGRIRSERFQQRIAHLPAPVKRLAYAFPRAIRRPTYRALHRLNTSYAPPPPLDPALRRRLNDTFRPDVERLSALIGRDLTHWCAE